MCKNSSHTSYVGTHSLTETNNSLKTDMCITAIPTLLKMGCNCNTARTVPTIERKLHFYIVETAPCVVFTKHFEKYNYNTYCRVKMTLCGVALTIELL